MAAVEENKLNAEQIKAITTKIGLQASVRS